MDKTLAAPASTMSRIRLSSQHAERNLNLLFVCVKKEIVIDQNSNSYFARPAEGQNFQLV